MAGPSMNSIESRYDKTSNQMYIIQHEAAFTLYEGWGNRDNLYVTGPRLAAYAVPKWLTLA